MNYICITGAGGSIGSEIARKFVDKEENLILIDSAEYSLFSIWEELKGIIKKANKKIKIIPILVNLANENDFIKAIEQYTITKIFHAAAYKHVNLIEKNPYSGLKIIFIQLKILQILL
ncbi:MAG: hypothetical protein CM15mP13_1350 [Pseudomonadota bacterium]|nr:MAG: hypothetical protein CM15mP13_1350 [Pseudomonadota bacterium]